MHVNKSLFKIYNNCDLWNAHFSTSFPSILRDLTVSHPLAQLIDRTLGPPRGDDQAEDAVLWLVETRCLIPFSLRKKINLFLLIRIRELFTIEKNTYLSLSNENDSLVR